jgi:uncharacterized protein (TIGR02145 family)
MKTILTVFFSMTIAFVSVSQKTKKEKIDFNKDIYPLLEVENFERAIPLMHAYYNQNLLLGEVWRPKVILLESNSMFYTQKILGDDYYKKASNSGSQLYIDSSRIWYNRMVAHLNPDSNYAKQQLKLIQQNEYSWKLEGPKKAQRLKEEQEKQRQQEAQKLAEETRKKNEERIEAENREKEIAERKRIDELAKQKEEQERAEAIKYKSVFKSIDSLIVVELPKLTSIQLCNSFVTKLEKYKTERNVKTQIFPLDNEVNGQTGEIGQSAIVAANIPNLEKLLTKRDKLIFEELKKQTTLELTNAFLLQQFLFENNIASTQGHEIYFIEKINRRVLNNLDATANGMVFFAKMFSEEEDGIYNKIVNLNYSKGQINKIVYSDGSVYTGETNDVYPNGSGKVVLGTEGSIFGIDNDKVTSFEGGFNLGYISEFGILKFKDKSVYEGANSNGVPNGKGKLTSATGVVQDGDFVDGVFKKPFSCKTAVIGEQIWMAENLSLTTFRNGDAIPKASNFNEWLYYLNAKKPCYAHEFFDGSKGIIYNAYVISDSREVAPEGWSIPTLEDWDKLGQKIYSTKKLTTYKSPLSESLDQDQFEYPISKFLQSKSGWVNESKFPTANANGTNDFNFNAVPNAWILYDDRIQFSSKKWAAFWTQTTFPLGDSYGYKGAIIHSDYWTGDHTNFAEMTTYGAGIDDGMAIRCIKTK